MYVEKYFFVVVKECMVVLVKNLQEFLGECIKGLSWMGEEIKEKVFEKLVIFYVKIGYLDKWKDYFFLEIKDDLYWVNIECVNQWSYNEMIGKYGKLVDKDEWYMILQIVNVYYNLMMNEICFLVGIF